MLGFFSDRPSLSVTEIGHLLGLSVSTAHRITRALVRAGYLDQDERTERYRLGRMMAVLGRSATESLGLDEARQSLDQLAEASGESVGLGVLDGTDVLIVISVESHQPLRFDRASGSRTAAHASAIGKAILAYQRAEVASVVERLGELEAYTPRTVVDPAALVTQLVHIAKGHVAVNREERYAGVCALAAPLIDGRGVARAGVGVQVPLARFDRTRRHELAGLVMAAAAELAERLPLDRL